MSQDNYTCRECHEKGCDARHQCDGSADERFAALAKRLEALEAQAIQVVLKATYNPTDTHDDQRFAGYFVDPSAARDAVKGIGYYNSDGRVDEGLDPVGADPPDISHF